MSALQIRKLQSGTFKHIDSIDGDFFLGRFNWKNEFEKAFLVEAYGAKRREYVISDITVYDYLGFAETFLNFTDLNNRLTELGYTGIDLNPVYPSTVETVTGNIVDNTDVKNPIVSLTPENVGEFMDIELPTKLTPMDADSILARDVLTNEAIEIPFSAFRNGLYGLNRQQFTYSGSQTFTLAINYSQVYSVSVQGGGALKDTQYTLVSPNKITILDTLDSGDYIVVLYSSSAVGVQPYYTQAVTDALLTLKQNKFYSNKLTTPSISLTGTLSETELVKITIPANTFSSSDIIRIPTIMFTKVGVNNAATVRLKISTSATMPAGGTSQIAQFTVNATTLYQNVNRTFYVEGGNLKGFPFTTAANTDIGLATSAMSTVAFDRTVTQYLYISGMLLSAADSLRVEGLQIMNS